MTNASTRRKRFAFDHICSCPHHLRKCAWNVIGAEADAAHGVLHDMDFAHIFNIKAGLFGAFGRVGLRNQGVPHMEIANLSQRGMVKMATEHVPSTTARATDGWPL